MAAFARHLKRTCFPASEDLLFILLVTNALVITVVVVVVVIEL